MIISKRSIGNLYARNFLELQFYVDKEGKYNGWQMNPDELENRDIKFFDVVFLKFLKQEFRFQSCLCCWSF